jgi:hypothetical protein
MTTVPDDTNLPVLIGPLPLRYVQSMTITEGYRIERIAGSKFSQAVSPSTKEIAIEALLIGPGRLLEKKALEALALVSRAMVAATAPLLKLAGIPVVSGLTIALDMQITSLRFNQVADKRDALSVSVTLQHVPRSSAATILAEAADLALAIGTAAVPMSAPASPTPRSPGAPMGTGGP